MRGTWRTALVVAVTLVLLGSVSAFAAWTSTGRSGGASTSTTLNRANQPTATLGSGRVTLVWAPSLLATGDAVDGYRVLRHSGATVTQVCVATGGAVSCDDTSPVGATVQYGVVATKGLWSGPESPLTSVTFDTTAPTTTAVVGPAPNAAGWNRTDATVTLSATDAGSGVASTQYSLNGGAWTSYAAPVPVGTEGSTTVAYRSTDVAGNVETQKSTVVKVDKTAPTTSAVVTPTPNGAGWGGSAATVTLTATDATSGVATTEYSLTSGGPWTAYTAPVAVGTEGSTTVYYRSTDAAGNVEAQRSTVAKVDTVSPTTTATVSPAPNVAGWNKADATVTLSATDAGSGVASTQYSLTGGTGPWTTYTAPVAVGTEGTTTVWYRSTDAVGHVEAATSTVVRLDKTAPTTTASTSLTPNGAGWVTADTTVTLGATDTGSGVALREYSLNGGSTWTTYAAPFTVSTEGTTTVLYRSKDIADNQEVSRTLTVKVDKTPPSTSAVVSPAPNGAGWDKADALVALAGSDTTSGISSTQYSLNGGGTWTTYAAPVAVSTEGSTTISYRSTDAAGNVEVAKSTLVKLDKTSPATSASTNRTPNTAGWVTADTTVTLSATDTGSGVALTEYSLNGGSTWTTYAAPFTVSTEGTTTVLYRSKDAADNQETSKTLTVKLDKTAPTTVATRSGTTLTLTATDATSGVLKTEYKIGAGAFVTYTAPFAVASGQTVTFRSTDNAGLVESPDKTYVVPTDVTGPTVTPTDLVQGGAYDTGNNGKGSWAKVCTSGNVCATVVDSQSTVASVTYLLQGTGGTNAGKCWNGSAFVTGSTCSATTTSSGSTYTGTTIPPGTMGTGSYSLTYTATDSVGNVTTVTLSFTTG